MAFQPNESTAVSNTRDNGNFEKAKAFLNFWLPTASGGRIKVGAIPLVESNKGHKAVLDYLNTDDPHAREALLLNILNKIQMDFTPVESKAVELAL